MTKTKPASGRPFRKGQSGNQKGRPKGARTRPVEMTVEQEIERLTERGIELVVMGETELAVTAFEKVFAMSWCAQSGSMEPGSFYNYHSWHNRVFGKMPFKKIFFICKFP